MKKLTVLLAMVGAVAVSAGLSHAAFVDPNPWTDSVVRSVWINNDTNYPLSNAWFQLDLPDWYSESVDAGLVSEFEIDLYGHGDNSNKPIDVFLAFDASHSSGVRVASYNVPMSVAFELTVDVLNGRVELDGSDVGAVMGGLTLASFKGYDSFWVGYACHFTHDESEVDIGYVPTGPDVPPVPEPGTMILLGSGLLGLARYGRKKAGS